MSSSYIVNVPKLKNQQNYHIWAFAVRELYSEKNYRYTPKQKGFSDCPNRTLVESTKFSLFDAELGK